MMVCIQTAGLRFCIPIRVLLFEAFLVALATFFVLVSRQTSRDGMEVDGPCGSNKSNKSNKSLRALTEATPPGLARRAILLKRWMMVAHESHFPNAGDYRSYTVAEIPFFVVRGRDGKLRAFHNVCRHRAYAVVRRSRGNTLRLSCKYHGWQYDVDGRLVKAPQFLSPPQPGFDAADNGLFEMHLRTDASRFVFVNLATSLLDAFPWSDASSPALETLDFCSALEWEIVVSVEWRIASLLPWFINPARFARRTWQAHLFALGHVQNHRQLQYIDDGSFMCVLADGRSLLISALPATGHKTTIRCTCFFPARGKQRVLSPPGDMQSLVDDEILSAIAQLKRFRPSTADLGFQSSAVRESWDKMARHIKQHMGMEKKAGKKINPAARVTRHDAVDVEAEKICDVLEERRAVECELEQGSLDW